MKILTKGMNISEIADACGGKYTGKDALISGFSTDSGEIFEGTVFVAIKGERRDGADFIPEVIKNGASCAISATVPGGFEDKVILVDDSVKALGRLASQHREKRKDLQVVGITGSVGKTTTKEMVYSVMSEKFNVHKTHGNHNSLVGLPMSILTLDESYNAAVYEMGMSQRGQISNLSKIVKPDIAIITNVGNMHIEFLGSREAIRDAKCEVSDGLKEDGILILNADEPLLAGKKAIYVGLENPNAEYKAENIREDESGTVFDIVNEGKKLKDVYIPAFGKHNVLNAAMAYAAGVCLGMSDEEIRRGLSNFKGEGMRQNFVEWGDYVFMEDCYNAGPESMKASLGVLEGYCKRRGMRPVAVLGQMRELGDYSDSLHTEVGAYAAGKVELLFTVKTEEMAKGAKDAGLGEERVISLGDMAYDEGASIIKKYLKKGDCVMFKASRGVKLEELIQELKK